MPRRWPQEDQAELKRTHWRRPILIRYWLRDGMPPPGTSCDYETLCQESSDDQDGPVSQRDLWGRALEQDQTWGNDLGFHQMLQQL